MGSDDQTRSAPRPLVFGGGRYVLRAALGSRHAGGVFLARDREEGRDCALKLLDSAAVPEEAVERFLAEARVLRDVRHRHVVHAWDHGHDHGFCWYAMELLPGGSLADLLRAKRTAPPDHALSLTFQVLMGLHAIHSAGLVHRDVKLTNVLVDAHGDARITDFGVAHHPKGTVEFETVPGQALGTPGYGAPEQWTEGGNVGAPADLFATGVLLYRLLTRKRPDYLHLAQYRPTLLRDVPEPLRPLLLEATRPQPEDRYADAAAMARAVVEARDAWLGVSEARAWMARFAHPAPDWRDTWSSLRAWLTTERRAVG